MLQKEHCAAYTHHIHCPAVLLSCKFLDLDYAYTTADLMEWLMNTCVLKHNIAFLLVFPLCVVAGL